MYSQERKEQERKKTEIKPTEDKENARYGKNKKREAKATRLKEKKIFLEGLYISTV